MGVSEMNRTEDCVDADIVMKEPEVETATIPTYTMQALWGKKLSLKDFEVSGEDKPTLPYDVFEQDEVLPIIDLQALLGNDKDARYVNLARMLEAAKTWGFFKIRNHGVALETVYFPHPYFQLNIFSVSFDSDTFQE